MMQMEKPEYDDEEEYESDEYSTEEEEGNEEESKEEAKEDEPMPIALESGGSLDPKKLEKMTNEEEKDIFPEGVSPYDILEEKEEEKEKNVQDTGVDLKSGEDGVQKEQPRQDENVKAGPGVKGPVYDLSEMVYPVKELPSAPSMESQVENVKQSVQQNVQMEPVNVKVEGAEVDFDTKMVPVFKSCDRCLVKESDQLKKWNNVLFVGTNGRIIAYNISLPLEDQIGSDEKKWLQIDKKNYLWLTKLYSGLSYVDRVVLFFEPELNKLYATHKNKLYCLDPDTGAILWSNGLFHSSQYILSLPEGVYTVGVKNLQVFRKDNGLQRFHLKLKGSLGGVDDHSVMTLSHHPDEKNSLFVINNKGVNKVDRRNLSLLFSWKPKEFKLKWFNLLPYDSKYFLAASRGYIYVLDASTAEVKRKTKLFKGLWNWNVAMSLRNKKMLIVASGSRVMCFDPLTHVKKWDVFGFKSDYPKIRSKHYSQDFGCRQMSLLQDDDGIYVGGAGRIKKLDPNYGKEIFNAGLKGCGIMYVSMMLHEDKGVIFCGSRGKWYALSTRTGKTLWKSRLKTHGTARTRKSKNIDHVAQPYLQGNWKERHSSY